MFGLSSLELRLALYGVLLAAIGGWMAYERFHLIAEGEARIKAQDASARAAQKAEDEKTSAGVINDLKTRLAAIPAAQPAPHLILCQPPRSVRTGTAPGGSQPALATAPRNSPSGVPSGAPGIDIGRELQDAREASQVIAIYRDTTWDWALKQTQNNPKP